jgi:hypothetical protein
MSAWGIQPHGLKFEIANTDSLVHVVEVKDDNCEDDYCGLSG